MDINTIFETNILNLIVVIRIVVKVIGNAAREFLDDRIKGIRGRFEKMDVERDRGDKILSDAQAEIVNARKYIHTIKEQCTQTICTEETAMHESLKQELLRIEAENATTVQLKKQETLKKLGCTLIDRSIHLAELQLATLKSLPLIPNTSSHG
jgi:F0F1-type ATP synthase membrane subunit b/b'